MADVNYDVQKTYWEGKKKRRSPSHDAVKVFACSKLGIILDNIDSLSSTMTMLEVGAGNGYFSQYFKDAFDLTCLDFSANMLEMNPLPADQKVVGDAENLPFEDNAFDVVFCGNLLHHLEDPSIAVKEMRRVARRHVVLIEPNTINPLMFLFGALKKEERGTLKFTPSYIVNLGVDSGLRLRKFESQGTVLPNKTPLPLLPLIQQFETSHAFGFYHIAIFDVPEDV